MWPNPQETPDLVTFIEETLKIEKRHFLYSPEDKNVIFISLF